MRVKEKKSNQKNRIETILKIAISASLGSLGVVLSTIVVLVPNFELISVTIFLVSILFGVYYGLLTAISVSLVYEFIVTSIYGSASYLVIFKLIVYITLALIAGIARDAFLKLSFWELGVFGSFIAFLYDVIVTLGYMILIPSTPDANVTNQLKMRNILLKISENPTLVNESNGIFQGINFYVFLLFFTSGIVFTIIHVITNFMLFSFVRTILIWIMDAFKVRGLKQLMLPSFPDIINEEKNLLISNEVEK